MRFSCPRCYNRWEQSESPGVGTNWIASRAEKNGPYQAMCISLCSRRPGGADHPAPHASRRPFVSFRRDRILLRRAGNPPPMVTVSGLVAVPSMRASLGAVALESAGGKSGRLLPRFVSQRALLTSSPSDQSRRNRTHGLGLPTGSVPRMPQAASVTPRGDATVATSHRGWVAPSGCITWSILSAR